MGEIRPALIFVDFQFPLLAACRRRQRCPLRKLLSGELATNAPKISISARHKIFLLKIFRVKRFRVGDENSCFCFVLAGPWGGQSDCVLISIRRTNLGRDDRVASGHFFTLSTSSGNSHWTKHSSSEIYLSPRGPI